MTLPRMGTRRAVGLRDIAEELNLSVSMVSKVLNGRMGTSGGLPETVRAIREKARELGYQKNLQAQALRTGRVNVIAVCVHHHGERGSLIVEAMVEGIAREAALHQQRLVLHYYTTLEQLQKIWHDFSRSEVDGVILGGVPHLDWLHQVSTTVEEGIEVVTILPSEVSGACLNVGAHEQDLGRLATLHLLDQGCRRLVNFSVRSYHSDLEQGLLRTVGFRRAHAERGIPVCEELVLNTEHFSYECGLESTRKLVQSGVPFDGIVAQSDNQAMAALNVLTAAGIRIPDQVKLVGVDDSPFCEMASVPISSVSQEFYERGQLAVRVLIQRIAGQDPESVVVAPVLRVRQSSSRK